MKNLLKTLLIAVPVLLIFSCERPANVDETADNAEDINEESEMVYEEDDAEFVVEAYSYNLMLQEYGQVAMNKETAPENVKQVAQSSVEYHQQLNNELEEIARKNNIVLPATVGENVSDFKQELMEKEGLEFADDYIDVVDDIQSRVYSEYREAATETVDPELQAWIELNLPLFAAREEMIDEMEEYVDELE